MGLDRRCQQRRQRRGGRRQCRRRGRVPFAALIRVGRPAARRSPFDTVREEPDEGGLFIGVAGAHAAGVQFGRQVRVYTENKFTPAPGVYTFLGNVYTPPFLSTCTGVVSTPSFGVSIH